MLISRNGTPLDSNATSEDAVLNIAFAFWQTTLLLSADELGVFAALRDGAADVATLQAQLGLGAETARDFLFALAGLGLLEECGGIYRNSGASARFLDPAAPEYLGTWLAMARAAKRETISFTDRLQGAARPHRADASPLQTNRMWADITTILDAASTQE